MRWLTLFVMVLSMNCRVLIPKEHQESQASWKSNNEVVEVISRYKARISWNPLSQETIAGPAKSEVLVYETKPAQLSVGQGRSIGIADGRIMPGTLTLSGSTAYFLVEHDSDQLLYQADLGKGGIKTVTKGSLLSVSASGRALAIFGLSADGATVWLATLDEKGALLLPVQMTEAQPVDNTMSTPLFRWMNDELFIKTKDAVIRYVAGQPAKKADLFPACFYPMDIESGLSPDGRYFSRDNENKINLIQSDAFRPSLRMTTKFDDTTGC